MEVVEEDLYAVLGVDSEATDAQIRKAYKKLAVELHPDRYVGRPSEQEEAQKRFAQVSHAYNVLKDAEQRNEYDFMRRLQAGESGGANGPEPALDDEAQQLRRERGERYFKQGMARQMDRDFKGAIDSFKEAIRHDASVAQWHSMLAVCYQKLGWHSYAKAEVDAALKLDPRDALAVKLRNVLREHERNTRELEAKEAKKGKKKKKGKAQVKSRAATGQVAFKKKRTSFFENLLNLFRRKAND
ncbi:Chaperone protein DnaJ [compost metagenome]